MDPVHLATGPLEILLTNESVVLSPTRPRQTRTYHLSVICGLTSGIFVNVSF